MQIAPCWIGRKEKKKLPLVNHSNFQTLLFRAIKTREIKMGSKYFVKQLDSKNIENFVGFWNIVFVLQAILSYF